MVNCSSSLFLEKFFQNCFDLKQHLQGFLNLDSNTLAAKLESSQQQLAELGHRDFDWENATKFYQDTVKEMYLFELSAWHLASSDYIGDTLRLIADQAKGRVLDFGGGIGTHAIGAALSPDVEQVIYCDINPISISFVQYRAQQLNLSDKICFCTEIFPEDRFDTIISFDVIEHLSDPQGQLLKFYNSLTDQGRLIMNWYFFKGFNQEFPFHLDDPEIVNTFFETLQSKFLEVFHPYLMTTRCYRKWIKN